jgi:Membrane protein involved in the export of O-antigen and teichoic acid
MSEPAATQARRSSFLRNALAYTSTNLVSQFTQLVSRFIVRTILAPQAMGIWEFALVIQSFANSFDPGINAAASVELPMLHGAQDRETGNKVRATVFSSNFLFSLLLAAGILVYLFLYWNRFDRHQALAVVVAALLVIFFSFSSSLITFHQGNQSYVSLSKASLYYALLYGALISLGAYLQGIVGVLIAGALSYLIQSVLLYVFARKEDLKIGRLWDQQTFIRLAKFGLPMRVVEYPQSIFAFLDVFLVTKFLGIGPLAIYATARVFFLQTANIPAVLGNVFVTRIFYLSGAKTSRATLAEEMKLFLLVEYLLVLPLLICSVCLAFSFLTGQFIPAYLSSVPVIRVLIFAVYFVPQTTLVRNFWMLDKRLLALGVSNVVGFVGMAASFLIVMKFRGLTLDSIALASVVGYFIYYLYIMLSIGVELWGKAGAVKIILHALAAVVITKLILNTTPINISQGAFANNVEQLLISLLWSYALLLPMLAYGAWKTRLLQQLRARFARKQVCAE